MCDLYYLDQIREAVAEAKLVDQIEATATNEKIDAVEEKMRTSLEGMDERTAKLSLDLAYVKIACVPSGAARERLVRYFGELHRRAMADSVLCKGEEDV